MQCQMLETNIKDSPYQTNNFPKDIFGYCNVNTHFNVFVWVCVCVFVFANIIILKASQSSSK